MKRDEGGDSFVSENMKIVKILEMLLVTIEDNENVSYAAYCKNGTIAMMIVLVKRRCVMANAQYSNTKY